MRYVVLLVVTLSGCLLLYPIKDEPRVVEARGPAGNARVELVDIWRARVVMLRVLNRGPGVLTVNRRNFLLRSGDTDLEPVEGWGDKSYAVAPGEDQDVNLKFDLGRLGKVQRGDELEIVVNDALWMNGKPLRDAATIHVLVDRGIN